jgi:proteasome lid subunit RPN8/RPN11
MAEVRPDWHPAGLRITPGQYEQMRAEAERNAPEEACGLVAGRGARAGDAVAAAILPVENALHSPWRFRMHPQQQVEAFLLMEEKGWDLLAIYHSHPQGPASPSATDLNEFAYPEALALIWSRAQNEWICRAFAIEDGRTLAAKLFVTSAG